MGGIQSIEDQGKLTQKQKKQMKKNVEKAIAKLQEKINQFEKEEEELEKSKDQLKLSFGQLLSSGNTSRAEKVDDKFQEISIIAKDYGTIRSRLKRLLISIQTIEAVNASHINIRQLETYDEQLMDALENGREIDYFLGELDQKFYQIGENNREQDQRYGWSLFEQLKRDREAHNYTIHKIDRDAYNLFGSPLGSNSVIYTEDRSEMEMIQA